MGALDGVKVLEFAGFIAGPLAGMLLADLGADVIKVESPDGDPFRHWGRGGQSPHFAAFNRNKRSVVLDMKSDAGREALLALAAECDVVIQNLRPAAAQRLGLTYEQLSERNPGVVVCGISAFGDRGPDVSAPGFDTMGQAVSGLLSLFADPNDPRPAGPAMADQLGGLFGAYAVLAALQERSRTGLGQQVSTSLLASSVSFAGQAILSAWAEGTVPDRFTRAAGSQAFAFSCKDGGLVAIHLSSPTQFWTGLLEAAGLADLASDPRFAAHADRVKNYEQLYQLLAGRFQDRTREEWLDSLKQHDVPCAPVLNVLEVAEHPQVQALGLLRSIEDPEDGPCLQVSNPIEGDVVRTAYQRPPRLGEHTDEVFAQFGILPTSADPSLAAHGA